MKIIRVLLAAAAFAVAGSAAQAQTMSYAQAGALLARSCGPDINRLCSNVNLGNGALLACMDSKIGQVSAQCQRDYAIAKASIAQRDAAQDSIARICSADTARLCPGMVPQDGNLLSCLLQATRVVSPACNQAITDAGYR
ncbi:cysteine rich repeat-containing protein [Xanthobacter pseudotagetidis]|uniref:cysteine rich repeat-containing protein n=1 Tax=Xanthobacter pseudotagetidis TaxID=3119911 RepID=UPI00372B2487